MRKYSPVIVLLAVITAMAIFQFETLDADAASSTPSSQTLQMNKQSMTGPSLMVPMDTRFAHGGEDKDADDDKKVGESEKKDEKPDPRTVGCSKASSVKKGNGNGNGDGEDKEDEDKKDEEGGGFDRLWDVVSNG